VIEHDPRFRRAILPNTRLERLHTGGRWFEGPAYFPAGRYLVWSDIPNDRILRWDETDASVSTFRHPAGHTNGHTRDREGRLVSCEHHHRRVTRTEPDGAITILASHWQGHRLNSPNDVVVASDGAIWFTDPAYGIDTDYEGERAPSEIGACHVYRLDPAGHLDAVATDFTRPNGLAFSPDESLLYIVDTGATHVESGPRHIRRFRVDGGRLAGGEVFATCQAGLFDGIRVDTEGRLWASAADGIHLYDPDATLLGRIPVPEVVANLAFGGPRHNRLFICATTSLYSVYVNARGAGR